MRRIEDFQFHGFRWGIFGLAVLAAGLLSVGGASARTMTPLDVANTHAASSVALSPDGSAYAFIRSVPRSPFDSDDGHAYAELWVGSTEGKRGQGAPVPYVHGEVKVSQIAFSPDGRWLTYVAKRDGDSSAALYAIAVAGGESVRLLAPKKGVRAYDWAPDGSRIAYVSTVPPSDDVADARKGGFDQEIFEETFDPHGIWVATLPADIYSGKAKSKRLDKVVGNPFHVQFGPRGERLAIDVAPSTRVDDYYMARTIAVVDAGTGKELARVEHASKLGPFRWHPKGRSIAFVAGIDIHDPKEARLFTVPATGGAPTAVMPEADFDFVSIEYDRDGDLTALVYAGTSSRLVTVNTDKGRAKTRLDGPALDISRYAIDARGKRWVFAAGTPTSPREPWLFDGGSDARRLVELNPWMSGIDLAKQEVVRYPAADGLEIEGMLIRPLSGAKAAPLIVVAHGGPESSYRNGWMTWYASGGQVAAAKGYAVFYPNYRGSTGRGVTFIKTSQGDAGGKEFDDVLAGVDYLVEQGVADTNRVGITGGSYGGYMTAWGATKHSKRFKAGVMFVGISNQLSKVGTTDIPNESKLVHWLTTPNESPDLFVERSPITYVAQSQTPLLILHGKKDTRVDPGQSRELYRALKRQGNAPVRLVLYPRDAHGNRNAASRYDYSQRMLRWFDSFLAGDAKEMPPVQWSKDVNPTGE